MGIHITLPSPTIFAVLTKLSPSKRYIIVTNIDRYIQNEGFVKNRFCFTPQTILNCVLLLTTMFGMEALERWKYDKIEGQGSETKALISCTAHLNNILEGVYLMLPLIRNGLALPNSPQVSFHSSRLSAISLTCCEIYSVELSIWR